MPPRRQRRWSRRLTGCVGGSICSFISDAVYEGRLKAHPSCAEQRLILPEGSARYEMASNQAFVHPLPLGNQAPAFPTAFARLTATGEKPDSINAR